MSEKIKDGEMCRVCSTHGKEEKCIETFSRKLLGRDHFEDLVIDTRIRLKWTLASGKREFGFGSTDSELGPVTV